MSGVLFRPMLSRLSPSGPSARLSLLIYHRILPERDPLLPGEIAADTFRWHLDLIRRLFTPLPLAEAVDGLKNGRLPPRPVCITFDDGYEDNASVALPLLRETGVPATFFVATDYLDGGTMFNDRVIESVRRLPAGTLDLEDLSLGQHELSGTASRVACYSAIIRTVKYLPWEKREEISRGLAERVDAPMPTNLMMRREQVRALSRAGMEVGGHTASHPILTRIENAMALEEMRRGRVTLEEILDRPVRFFAYPNGKPGKDYDARHVAMAQDAGFEAAVSTASGVATRGSDLYQLPRFTPWDRTPLRFTARLAINLLNRNPRVV